MPTLGHFGTLLGLLAIRRGLRESMDGRGNSLVRMQDTGGSVSPNPYCALNLNQPIEPCLKPYQEVWHEKKGRPISTVALLPGVDIWDYEGERGCALF
mmetsp:Transcript_136549/g.236990  ORF Transcript_136549/g.236990 Transcript_136549/m.236990 type:complete len:98 (-) Transcript_136549:205-498(-)